MRRRIIPAAVLVASIVALVTVVGAAYYCRPQPVPAVTLITFRRLVEGMPRGHVEGLLGPGRDERDGTTRHHGDGIEVVLTYRYGVLIAGHLLHDNDEVEEVPSRPSLADLWPRWQTRPADDWVGGHGVEVASRLPIRRRTAPGSGVSRVRGGGAPLPHSP
jgi:hypothetical protein